MGSRAPISRPYDQRTYTVAATSKPKHCASSYVFSNRDPKDLMAYLKDRGHEVIVVYRLPRPMSSADAKKWVKEQQLTKPASVL